MASLSLPSLSPFILTLSLATTRLACGCKIETEETEL